MNRFLAAACIAMFFAFPAAARADITVSAAISLKAPLEKAQPDLEKSLGEKITFNFGASGTLLAQIEKGAPVDLFISADQATADKLITDKAGDKPTERPIASNSLVLIAYAGLTDAARIPTGFADLLKIQKLAVGDPAVVPAGNYAKQVLTRLKLWDALDKSGKLVTAANVAQVLTYVQRGDADAGIVYATDAKDAKNVKVVATADPGLHDPINYVSVIVSSSAHKPAAARLQDALLSEKVQAAFHDLGFSPPPKPPATQPH